MDLAFGGGMGFCLSVMKTAKSLIAVVTCCLSLSAPVFGDGWATLAGHNDTVKLAPGETAFVVTVSERVTIQYEKLNKRPVQFELTSERRHFDGWSSSRKVVAPTTANPFPLVGPCTISVKSPGVVSMKIVKAKTK